MPFPVKALKLLLHDLQTGGEAASMGFSAKDVSEVASDDGVRSFACCFPSPLLRVVFQLYHSLASASPRTLTPGPLH